MQNKKITLLIGTLAGGGAEGVAVSIANGLSNIGWEVSLVVLNLNNAVNKERLNENVNLVNLNVSNVRYSFFALYKYIKSNQIKTFLVFDHLLSVMLVLIKFLVSNKYFIIARNINTLSKEINSYKSFWYKHFVGNLVKMFYKKVDFIINQSKGMMDDLLNLYPEFLNKTIYIHNPVNEKISNFAEKFDFKNSNINRDYFLCVGRLEEQKAFHYAIKAFAKISKEYPEIRLKIVGIGKLENSLKSLTKELNIENKVDFEGFQKNMISYYIGAKATLLTSLYEGFPNVLVESITLGTPIISFDCQSGPKEIIKQEENGYLVEYQNINQLEEYMKLMITKDFDNKRILEQSKIYTLENTILKYENVIKEFI